MSASKINANVGMRKLMDTLLSALNDVFMLVNAYSSIFVSNLSFFKVGA